MDSCDEAVVTERPGVLLIAGTDSSGGAGLIRDVMTLRDHDVAAKCAVTAVTAQSNEAVRLVRFMPRAVIGSQIEAALGDGAVKAIKIGMLGNANIVDCVVAALAPVSGVPIVLDPVLKSSSGNVLLDREGLKMMQRKLLSRCALVTPNLDEVSLLAGGGIQGGDDLELLAMRILDADAGAVLIKGGHGEGREAADWLFDRSAGPVKFVNPRLAVSMRGTGCALSSAIAANLARNQDVKTACRNAKAYVFRQLREVAGHGNAV